MWQQPFTKCIENVLQILSLLVSWWVKKIASSHPNFWNKVDENQLVRIWGSIDVLLERFIHFIMQGSCIGDCCIIYFCWACTLCQEAQVRTDCTFASYNNMILWLCIILSSSHHDYICLYVCAHVHTSVIWLEVTRPELKTCLVWHPWTWGDTKDSPLTWLQAMAPAATKVGFKTTVGQN